MKAILQPEAVTAYIDFHKQMNIPFTITLSNYTTRITSKLHDIHFMKTEHSIKTFAAFNKVKSQVTKTKIPVPKNYDNLQYYSHNFNGSNIYADTVFNIDLKSAYASVLLNDKLIDYETYTYLNSLPKMQRLAAVGMLAGKKNVFEIDKDGKIISDKTVISPTAHYFFYCVRRTAEIINECTQHLGDSFLFSWVDGIYFLENPDSAIKTGSILIEFLQEKGFKCSFDKLTEFNVEEKKDYYNCTYKKDEEFKVMKVPKEDHQTLQKLTNYLTKKTY